MNKDRIVNILNKIIEWSLYALILSIPFSKSVIEISITVAFIAWISKKILTKDLRLKKTPLNNLLFALFLITLISFVNAELKLLFMRSLVSKCLKYIVLYFIVVETINTKTKFKNVLTLGLISAIIVMLDSYLQHYVFHYDFFHFYPSFKYIAFRPWPIIDWELSLGFPTGPFPFPNDLSAWMLMILMPALSIFIWDMQGIRSKFIFGSFLFPFLYLFYLANTRSAWFAFIISFSSILLIQGKKLFIVFLILVLAVVIVVSLLPKEKTTDILGFSSFQDRLYMWRIGWRIFKEHPIIGNGLNMFFHKFKEYREDEFKYKRGSYAHNGFLQMAAEIGIIGLVVFILLIGKAFYSASLFMKDNKDIFYNTLSLGLIGGLSAFLIHSFFDTNLQSLPLVVLFWFGLSLLMSLQNIYARKI